MNDQDKSKEQLIAELAVLRQRLAEDRSAPELTMAAAVLRLAPLGIHACDTDGRITFVNPSQEALTGYAAHELIGTGIGDRLPPGPEKDSLPAYLKQLACEQPAPTPFFAKNIRKSGEIFDARIDWNYLRNAQGDVTGFISVVTDITEHQRAEEQAHASLEQRVLERTAELTAAKERLQAEVQQRRQVEERLVLFRRFAEAATQGFGMADLDGRITYVNPFLARLYGAQQPEDLIGRHVGSFYPPDYLPRREREIIPALRRGEHWRGEQLMVLSDGQLHPTIHSIFPVCDEHGTLLCTAAVITDITDLRRAEDALRQSYEETRLSQEPFELAVRGAGVGIWDWDIRTGKVYYSPRWKTLFGYDESEIGEGFADWATRLHPEEREAVIKLQEDFLAGTSPNVSAEYRLRHRDGSYRWIEAHAVVVRDEQGRACRLVGSHADITVRKLAEEKVKTEQRALRRMVLAGDHERRLITYELHDGAAQQLMGAIMHFQALEPSPDGAPRAVDAYREGMKALRQASSEIRTLMSRLRTPVLDMYGLAAAIEDVLAQLRSRPGAPEIECRYQTQFQRLEPTLENTLFRIAQEALTNACRHSQSKKVRVQLAQQGDWVTLEVRDWGIGFDKASIQGNRFGLEGIRQRCRLLGGNLNLKTKPGGGTMIRVKFPLAEGLREEG